MKFSIWTIASFGDTISVIVRRSTLTIRSTTGMRMNRPGPFGCGSNRPSRKTMPRSYSRATLIAAKRNNTIRNRRIAMMTRAALTPTILCVFGLDGQNQAVERLDADVVAGAELFAPDGAGLPQLAVDEHEP